MKKGFTTIEIMIAMSIMVITLTSVVLVSFGNQTSLISSETNSEALKRAQGLLERQQALARKDFNLVNSTTTNDGFYTDTISVNLKSDFLTKEVGVEVSWTNERGIEESVVLSGLVSNFDESVGGSTCNSSLSGDWTDPDVEVYNFNSSGLLPSSLTGTYPISDLDAYRGRLFVTVDKTAVNIDKTFFVLDISNQGSAPNYLAGTDNAGSTRNGLNAVKVAGNYAYTANAHDANFNSCLVSPSCAQLQIIDLSSVSSSWSPTIISYKLATSSNPQVRSSGGSGQAVGKNIFYRNGYIYLGLTKTASGPEFHVIDVHNPNNPFWTGSWPAPGTSSLQPINDILIRNGYAYLAHPTDSTNSTQEQLTVLNINDPQSPTRVSGFHAPDNNGNGKSLGIVGDLMYLGRTITTLSTNPEFYILDISNSTSVSPTPLGSYPVDNSANDLLIRDNLAFILTNNSLKIIEISNPGDINLYASIPLPNSSVGTSLDCEGNYLYVGSRDTGGNGFISIITGS